MCHVMVICKQPDGISTFVAVLVIAGRCIDLKAKGSDKIISCELQDTGHRNTSP